MDVDLSGLLNLEGVCNTNLSFEIDDSNCNPKDILEDPSYVVRKQKDYILNGGKILYAQTSFATSEHLGKYGLEEQTESINTDLVNLTKSVSEDAVIGGVISTLELEIEPFGETTYTEIIRIYREQATFLAKAGVDFFVLDSMLSISKTRAAVLALRKLKKPIVVTMCLDENGNTLSGGSAINTLIILQELGVFALGIKSNCDDEKMCEILAEMKAYAKIPIITNGYNISDKEKDINISGDIILADTKQIYNLIYHKIDFSPAVECSVDMADELLQMEEESYDIILVEINNIDDAKDFADNAHLANLPVCFSSHDEISLRLALMLYNGIAMIDANSSIDEDILIKIAKKYGAVIY